MSHVAAVQVQIMMKSEYFEVHGYVMRGWESSGDERLKCANHKILTLYSVAGVTTLAQCLHKKQVVRTSGIVPSMPEYNYWMGHPERTIPMS
jgi:hypothetical protein